MRRAAWCFSIISNEDEPLIDHIHLRRFPAGHLPRQSMGMAAPLALVRPPGAVNACTIWKLEAQDFFYVYKGRGPFVTG